MCRLKTGYISAPIGPNPWKPHDNNPSCQPIPYTEDNKR